MSNEIIAIIPAAGIGSRMQSGGAKQYLPLGGKTVIEHAISPLLKHPAIKQIVVVLHADDHDFIQLPLGNDSKIRLVTGGAQRADSVLAGLLSIDDESGWVLVHDAARPCLHADDLTALLALINHSPVGGLLAAPVVDTIKQQVNDTLVVAQTVNRQDLWRALTPQLFPLALLKRCLQQAMAEAGEITDESSALEHCGYQPVIIPGRADNIKITYPEDLALAEFYLSRLRVEESD